MIRLISLLREAIEKPKAIFLAGAPGAGKGTVVRNLNLDSLSNLKVFNIDDEIKRLSKEQGFTLDQKKVDSGNRSTFASAMSAARTKLMGTKDKKGEISNTIENKESFILDGTSSSYNETKKLYDQLKENGYDVMMIFIYNDLETSLKNNQDRFEKSGGEDRSLMPSAVYRTWLPVYKNFKAYKELFGDNFVSISNRGENETMKDIKQIFKTYILPYTPKDAPPKSEEDKIKSEKANKEFNQQMEEFLNSGEIEDIINTSMSIDDAKTKINQFLS